MGECEALGSLQLVAEPFPLANDWGNTYRARGVGAAVSLGTKWRSENVRTPQLRYRWRQTQGRNPHVSAGMQWRSGFDAGSSVWKNGRIKTCCALKQVFIDYFSRDAEWCRSWGIRPNTHARDYPTNNPHIDAIASWVGLSGFTSHAMRQAWLVVSSQMSSICGNNTGS